MNKYEENQALTLELEKPKLQEPPLYRVFLLNDDYTPMDFVAALIQRFFFHSEDKARHLMMQIHTTGKAVCAVYTQDVAETKIHQIMKYLEGYQYPLQCGMEPDYK
jgi:ATP-dependent Clp protease adaptor protein ClpS